MNQTIAAEPELPPGVTLHENATLAACELGCVVNQHTGSSLHVCWTEETS